MSWKQIRDASMKVGYTGGWCLKFVQDAFHTDHPYPTAIAAWKAEKNKHTDKPPKGVTVPVYLSLGNVPAGHVAISLSDGYIASSTQAGVHPAPYFHKSLDDLIAVYGKYNGGAKYLGWGEHVGTVQVVQQVSDNATHAEVEKAYQDILERPADVAGIAHYVNYPIAFVRQDLLNSAEHKALLAKKAAAAAKAAADAEAAQKAAQAEAKAKADAEAAAKAQAETEARQKAMEAQPAPHAVPPVDYSKENNDLLKQILALLKGLVDKFNGIFK